MYTYNYDPAYYPAFPVIEFGLINEKTDETLWLKGLVDSGSDATAIPIGLLHAVKARDIDDRWARGTGNIRYSVTMYRVSLTIAGEKLSGLEVIANEKNNEILLGRDVLNNFEIVLNGLAHMTGIQL
jgi:predicted aspartyl protease